jgi:hypothetical protein
MIEKFAAATALAAAFVISPRDVRWGQAEDLKTYEVSIQNGHFSPAELHVPAGKPFFLEVSNGEGRVDEFEMSSPPLEKLIQSGASGKLRVRPLANGRFPFFDDFHPQTTGAIVAE